MTPIIAALVLTFAVDADKPKREYLWPKGAPGAVGATEQDKPALTAHLPPIGKRNGSAVIVCPGGGYRNLAISYEGHEVADWLAERGVAGFVLEYRLSPRYRHPAALQDAQRAIRVVRSRAKEFAIDPRRIGIWGFSAGGHLASTAATKFDSGVTDAEDRVERAGCRPDFAILCYPVITFEKPFAHSGSREALLGKNPDDKLVQSLCNHKQVSKNTPPTFLFHTKNDGVVPVQNSELFDAACRKAGVPSKLVVYPNGPHGVGLGRKHPEVAKWPVELEAWMKERNLLPAKDGR